MTDTLNDTVLDRAGLESIAVKDEATAPEPMKYPRLVDENAGQLWLRCFVDGTDRECEVTKGQAWAMVFTLMGWLAKDSRR